MPRYIGTYLRRREVTPFYERIPITPPQQKPGAGQNPAPTKAIPPQEKESRFRDSFQLVDKPSLCGKQFLYAGGARGGKARLELDQMSRKALPCKACVEHPKGTCFAARSDYFRAARRHKITTLFQAVEKSRRFFRQPERSRVSATPFLSRYLCSQYASFSARYAFSSLMGTRTCSMVSRSRTVTQLSPAFSASPTVSKSTVMQNGVPTSSSRR